jgi:CDP-diacylglycerol--glycerol-3-phosphate 3-phosphatidyltransferase
MVDGTIARKTNSTSQFGSQLDTIADLVFVVVAIFKLLPVIHLPGWLWIWGGVIAIMKLASIIWGFVRIKKLVAYHSVFNKMTGLQRFLLPFTLQFIEPTYSFAVVCIIATIAAVQEACYTMS